jgi:hypothetical protein
MTCAICLEDNTPVRKHALVREHILVRELILGNKLAASVEMTQV